MVGRRAGAQEPRRCASLAAGRWGLYDGEEESRLRRLVKKNPGGAHGVQT